jgi:hypothetical protein
MHNFDAHESIATDIFLNALSDNAGPTRNAKYALDSIYKEVTGIPRTSITDDAEAMHVVRLAADLAELLLHQVDGLTITPTLHTSAMLDALPHNVQLLMMPIRHYAPMYCDDVTDYVNGVVNAGFSTDAVQLCIRAITAAANHAYELLPQALAIIRELAAYAVALYDELMVD